jgi:LysR family transcriptional activator of nhaA
LQEVLKGRPRGHALKLQVGVSDLVPKLVAYRILEPVLRMEEAVQIVCDEDTPDRLLADLAEHRFDVVLSEAPIPPNVAVKAFNHLLGSCGVTLFGAPELAKRYGKGFPGGLDGAPFLLPMPGSSLRRSLEQWFDGEGIRPRIVGEFKDGALMKTFGQAGAGLFVAPAAIEAEIGEHYKVAVIGRLDTIVERYYAISVERKLRHPAVVAISEAARVTLFAAE